MAETVTANYDQKTMAFYGTLLGLVILDLLLLAWLFTPVAQSMPLTSIRPFQATVVKDTAKPSPFEMVSKSSSPRRTPRVREAQASVVMPSLAKTAAN